MTISGKPAIAIGVLALAASTGAVALADDRDAVTSSDGGSRGASTTKARGTAIKVEKTEFGKALVNRAGRAVYLFDIETTPTPECYDDCARAWPPVLTKGRPVAGDGVKAGKLRTTTRTDGRRQVTFAGHPLYYYVHDTRDKILCQDVVEFGGRWLLVRRSGAPLR